MRSRVCIMLSSAACMFRLAGDVTCVFAPAADAGFVCDRSGADVFAEAGEGCRVFIGQPENEA